MDQILTRRSLIPNTLLYQLPETVKNELLVSSLSKQELFVKLYQNKSHSLMLTYLYLLPVVFSFHYGALNKWSKQVLFWITGGGILLWWLIDIVRLPTLVKEKNHTVAFELWDEVSSIGEGPADGLF